MFFALLGWTGMVRDTGTVWGAKPLVWFVLGFVVAVAPAVADMVLGRRADFTQTVGRPSASAMLVNRLLPWLIVAFMLIGLAARRQADARLRAVLLTHSSRHPLDGNVTDG